MPTKPDSQPHNFPQSLLEQINENSAGGYFLCLVNDYGDFSSFSRFDNEIFKRAILDYAVKTSKAYKKLLDEEHEIDVLQSEYGEGFDIIQKLMEDFENDEEENGKDDEDD
jgi:hypothetical protein